jgi:A/G-specific adenine glycosylase
MKSPTILTKSSTSDYPSPGQIKWFRQHLSAWGVINRRDFPWRNTTDSYHLLVAESLLQKTDAQTVAPIYTNYF